MALINSCNIEGTLKNTGVECNDAPKATAMLLMAPVATKWTETDELDFTAYLKTMFHAPASTRIIPIFGTSAPIRNITENSEADVIETMEDGSQQFVRYGMYGRTFLTDAGGFCLAKAMFAIPNKYGFFEIDIEGKVIRMKNSDGTFSPFPTNLAYAPKPELATLKTVYKNAFLMSFDPKYYIKKGEVAAADEDEDLLSLMGLLDVTLDSGAAYTNAGSTRATGTVTITAIGVDGDTIDIKVAGASISGGPVTKTASESSVTLLAAKIALAITTAALTNGGYTAVASVGAITISAPSGLGATINTVLPTVTIVGTITNSGPVAFSGGVTGTAILKVSVKTSCADTDLVAKYPAALPVTENFVVKNSTTGATITVSLTTTSAGLVNLTIPFINATYKVSLAAPTVLKAAGIEGYDTGTPALITVLN